MGIIKEKISIKKNVCMHTHMYKNNCIQYENAFVNPCPYLRTNDDLQ